MKSSEFWSGRPWIIPGVLERTILFVALAIFVVWLEFYSGLAFALFLNIPVIYATGLVLFLAWIISLVPLLVLRFSNKYVLRNDSLEIRRGIAGQTSFIITSSGFSDLEVHQSLFERVMDAGEIEVFSESEKTVSRKMVKVRHPRKIAEQIRFVMARPMVRLDGKEPSEQPR
jgi:membrane protein YdbS with pleckstrin-like domain